MPRESKKAKIERAIEVCNRLNARYPDAECALTHTSPFTLTIAVLLSAQTTDKAVNKVTPTLFSRWPDAYALSQASLDEVGEVIRTLGFWKAKAGHAIGCAQKIVSDFGGTVPHTMDELTSLPGVGRKTANIVLNDAFDIVVGIAVDTHVYRIAQRLKLTNASTPLKAEDDLLLLIPQQLWKTVNHTWILFGRETCDAKKPHCEDCILNDICPSAFKALQTKKKSARKK